MKKIILLIVSIVLVVYPAFARDVLIVSGHPEYPPIMWKENGAIVGVAAELAKTIFTELGVPFESKSTGPWVRVQDNAKNGNIDMIVASYINRERQTYMDYTIPFLKDPVSVFVWKGKTFTFNRWEDLKCVSKYCGENAKYRII